jgi:hypothetical protein
MSERPGGEPRDLTGAEDAAMRDLYRQLGEQDLPGDPPFDVEAGLRDLKKRLASTGGEADDRQPHG